jgi:hypothetical protein
MTSRPTHPELAFGPNPFFEMLAPYLPFEKMPEALERFPLASVDFRAIEHAHREALIEGIENHFVPTREQFEICSGVQILVRRALVLRDPTKKEERKRVNQIGAVEKLDDLKRIPTLDGAGMVLDGVTGRGKTALIRRVLEVLVPEPVVIYEDSPTCGWHRLTQCYYLYIDHPSNGTRGALLKRILMELDKNVGTSYFEHHARTTNLDTLLVVVCKLLSAHRVALLVIDENQQSNLSDSPWALEFVLFYHHLLNLGISVLLSGSPMAFEHLRGVAQVMRRFTTGGVHRLRPAERSSKWWEQDFVPGVRRFDLVDRWDVDPEWRNQFEFRHTAGLPGAYVALHKEVMRFALRRGGEICAVSQADFRDAISSPRYMEVLRIAKAIRSDSVCTLSDFSDLPPASTSTSDEPVANIQPNEKRGAKVNVAPDHLKRQLAAMKAKHTKEMNTLKKSIELSRTLSPDDVRMTGVTEELLRSMEKELEQRSEQKAGSKKQPNETSGAAE